MKNKKTLLLIILTAGFWWNLFNLKSIVLEWKMAPSYFKKNISSIFSSDNLMKIQEVRWNAFGNEKEDLLSKIYYNKVYVMLDNFFSFLSYTSPRPYFQAGDGTRFSPSGVEPIAGILFPFWVLGLISLIKNRNFKLIFWTLGISLFTFLLGKRNLAFLLPVLLIYINIASKSVNRKYLILAVLYMLFIIGRVIWLKN
ncbi:hypothetical protein A2422_02545 [Candidatus Woesebacteria bacterium RIFOXYC1_FULL_31_51]|uniref:Uncharacterized protein n=1 Tax=Candidatus Woesebacteria bacterium GW2011_GWC2_31_9 TaxID=1618586 RepID=A0A0G0BJ98_9BACT|nr:MAG: hypothetical protein UR17_C0001G0013 [Candidatus Woesebacteria bacterium GW2011_GWF1_31_35]KKP23489.1 MAG: hypothetical protein UR11_C0001G0463 [Candidatus Woesebacteria bacterium GW2011_GWC1_30_29]KKP26466.1 MAG: hypothetical protein UR13_C0004G0080 [Candidatus Woesebacteria bacterium GW2011_GWD1_31_12]KKP27765.1 MAG: hypothetical protein UR16_C0002G0095 [Candidatus Woesebacteria bacterium GW2011_GWB1_31_29]KKP31087.1 MAG: hypothetical protein UR21_C0016G0005 [Candidatus Woesebacteria 